MDNPKFGTKMENVCIFYLQKYKVKGTALDLVILERKGVVYDRFIKKAKLWVHTEWKQSHWQLEIPVWVRTSHWDCLLQHLNEIMLRSNIANSSIQAESKCVLSQKERGYPHAYLLLVTGGVNGRQRLGCSDWPRGCPDNDASVDRGAWDGIGKTTALPAGM